MALKPKTQRLYLIIFSLICVAVAVYLILNALKDNIVYYFTPAEYYAQNIPTNKQIRIGGLVKQGSFTQDGINNYFIITDNKADLKARYSGILPDLFREGQGVVATGKIFEGQLWADEVLAKHDENYMPREVYEKMKNYNPKNNTH